MAANLLRSGGVSIVTPKPAMKGRALIVAAVLGSSVVSGGWLLGRGLNGSDPSPGDARLFDAVLTHIRRYYVDSVPDSVLFERAMVGMLRELDDPYTLYLTPNRLRRLTEQTTGNYVGIGAQVQRRDDWPMIIAPFSGSPAERVGLRTGDRVVEIDGNSTRRWTTDETTKALRGLPETDVRLVIERPGNATRLSFRITRGGVHRRAVGRAALLPDGAAYVDVNIFNDSTELELRLAIDSLLRAGMRSLILDLRGNPGGVLSQGVGVADLFLDRSQTIVSMRGRTPEANQVFVDSSAQSWPKLPLVVLIDEWSASASEIVAGALQDHDRAVLMGRTSFGKGSAQGVFGTASGGAVKVTTARWHTPSGRSIDRPMRALDAVDDTLVSERASFRTDRGRTVYGGGGIAPDVAVGDTVLSPAEEQLDAALGTRARELWDAMAEVAIQLKTRSAIGARDFVVTPAMLEALWRSLRGRGFVFDRETFDGATHLLSQLLAREVARYVFGPQAEAERAIRDDEVIQSAARFLAGVASPAALIDRVPR